MTSEVINPPAATPKRRRVQASNRFPSMGSLLEAMEYPTNGARPDAAPETNVRSLGDHT